MPDRNGLADQIKNHPIVVVIGTAAVVATATWAINTAIYVTPRDEQIKQLKEQIEELKKAAPAAAAPSTVRRNVFEGAMQVGGAITTSDGELRITLRYLLGPQAMLRFQVGGQPTREELIDFHGARLVIPGGNAIYYVDLRNIRGDWIDLLVTMEPIKK